MMKKIWRGMFAVLFAATFAFTGLFGCGTGSITTVVTPAVVQTTGYAVGYYGWAFTSLAPVSQPAINLVCSLRTSVSSDPTGTLTQLENILSQSWTQAYNEMVNSAVSPLIIGAAQGVIAEINTLVGQLQASTTNVSQISQYAMAAIEGICEGVAAAQGKTTSELILDVKNYIATATQ